LASVRTLFFFFSARSFLYSAGLRDDTRAKEASG
jgi:hypothetical protein